MDHGCVWEREERGLTVLPAEVECAHVSICLSVCLAKDEGATPHLWTGWLDRQNRLNFFKNLLAILEKALTSTQQLTRGLTKSATVFLHCSFLHVSSQGPHSQQHDQRFSWMEWLHVHRRLHSVRQKSGLGGSDGWLHVRMLREQLTGNTKLVQRVIWRLLIQ